MESKCNIKSNPDTLDKILILEMSINRYLAEGFNTAVGERIVEKLVNDVCEEIVKQKFGEILSKVDTQAIANLSIARCANLVAEELKKNK